MASLECVVIYNCPKLTPGESVIQELTRKGVRIIHWNETLEELNVRLAEIPFSPSLHNFCVYARDP